MYRILKQKYSFCSICDKDYCFSDLQWEKHFNSKKHKDNGINKHLDDLLAIGYNENCNNCNYENWTVCNEHRKRGYENQ